MSKALGGCLVSRALNVLLIPGDQTGTFEDTGQYTAVYMHMDHLGASSPSADIVGRAKKVVVIMQFIFQHIYTNKLF